MTKTLEYELSDQELENLEATGGCQGATLGFGGLHFGFGHHLTLGLGGGFGGFSGFGFAPVQQVALVPVTQTVVAEPVAQTVAATSCQQQVALALV